MAIRLAGAAIRLAGKDIIPHGYDGNVLSHEVRAQGVGLLSPFSESPGQGVLSAHPSPCQYNFFAAPYDKSHVAS
jgi:hypothetical protein